MQSAKGFCKISSVKGLCETPRGFTKPSLYVQRQQGIWKPPLYRNKLVSWKGIHQFALVSLTLNCMHGPIELMCSRNLSLSVVFCTTNA